ncbi:MAG: class I SAM-dependent methyltransferase [Rhodobacteraceae bacterium]|nr:class I SAM-dependent methyltransferase [Paracoccaceae bacterium]
MIKEYFRNILNNKDTDAAEIYAVLDKVFDRHYYISAHDDLKDVKSDFDALDHFIRFGESEGRNPTPDFSTMAYRNANPDVVKSGINTFYHYQVFGKTEGRSPGFVGILPQELKDQSSIVAPEFDAGFYVDTCPVKVTHDGALEHYLNFGVDMNCDPSPQFSTEFYLNANADVRDAKVNPLFHYITCGRSEGRNTMRSNKAVPDLGAKPLAKTNGKMALGVIVMVKNEIDIIQTFVESIMALFDVVVMIDHKSEDGTAEYLKAVSEKTGRLHLYTLEEPGYHQALTMNHMLRNCAELDGLDWVFFLDADEFLPFPDRASFQSSLAELGDFPVISMRWSNLIPETYWQGLVAIDSNTQFYHNPELSPFTKIALQPSRVKLHKIWVEQGNHSVTNVMNGLPMSAHSVDFPVFHIPVRSKDQLLMKLNQGVVSYVKIGKNRDKVQGSHWFKIQENIRNTGISNQILNAVTDEYGIPDTDFLPLSTKALKDKGYFLGGLNLAKQDLGIQTGADLDFAENMFRLNAGSAVDESELEQGISKLVTQENGKICRDDTDTGFVYSPLPVAKAKKTSAANGSTKPKSQTDTEFLQNFLKPSYWDIRHLTPSAWTGHIPFLFSLTAMEQPRRYVELGSHFGASFFAFCQAVERSAIDCEPIAVDCWEGDIHAGKYDESVFNNFKFILNNYKDFASYLRMFFNEAAERFSAGSVDLLHIDGLHTYEAVREDYETWLPKMSDRGIIMFHDINVHERDFGVWKLWEELRDVHPQMEFRHSHGLGVIYVGKKSGRPIEKLIEIFNRDRWAKVLIQQHFEEISQKSAELFVKRFDQTRYEEQGRQFGVLNEEISRLKQSLAIAKTERSQLQSLIQE